MADENPKGVKQEPTRTLTDDQIVTERKLPRRSFLTAAGTLLAGGTIAIVAGKRAAAQDTDSDAKPEKKKDNDADKKKKKSSGSKLKTTKKAKKAKTTKKDTDSDQGK